MMWPGCYQCDNDPVVTSVMWTSCHQCDVNQLSPVWCGPIVTSVMWRDVTWRDVTWRDVTWRDVMWPGCHHGPPEVDDTTVGSRGPLSSDALADLRGCRIKAHLTFGTSASRCLAWLLWLSYHCAAADQVGSVLPALPSALFLITPSVSWPSFLSFVDVAQKCQHLRQCHVVSCGPACRVADITGSSLDPSAGRMERA